MISPRPTTARTAGAATKKKIAATDSSFTFDGTVSRVTRSRWTIGEVTVAVNSNTRIIGSPQMGDRVHVVAIRVNDTWVALVISKF